VFPLDQIAYDGVSPNTDLKLISREIIFEVFETELLSSKTSCLYTGTSQLSAVISRVHLMIRSTLGHGV